ncbi:MAG: prepilin-type N-terminal cleavage/methylation domain-containing protein [Planctomycetota bacterium]|nr:prepilin-type N-terminal cleavage/methylation domain-containing protein [Planctomycetota bacterium]
MRPVRRGFTLIELVVVLALVVVVMGLVIVRFDLGSPRQQTVREARALANLIGNYRERAKVEDAIYALRLDAEDGRCSVYRLTEKRLDPDRSPAPIYTHALPGPLRFRSIQTGNDSPRLAVLYFDARGIVPPTVVDLVHREGPRVRLRLDPLDTEVALDE